MVRAALVRKRSTVLLAVIAVAIGASVASALVHVSGDVSRKLSHELRSLGPNLLIAPASPGSPSATGSAGLGDRAVPEGGTERLDLRSSASAYLDAAAVTARLTAAAILRTTPRVSLAAGSSGYPK